MTTITTVTTKNTNNNNENDDRDGKSSSSSGCYGVTNTYFTLVRRENGENGDDIGSLEHRHRESLTENPYYKLTVELATLGKKKKKLERDIKALVVMLNEKTMEDELYEPESALLKETTRKYHEIQKEYYKKAKTLRDSLS
jgi:hypothetical protein